MVFGDPAEIAAYEGLVSAFNATQAEIEVELGYIPSQDEYRRRLATDFAGGAPPDVMLLNYRRFAAFADQGGLEPLDNYLQQSTVLDQRDFYPAVLEAFRLKGRLWCIPQNLSSLVVYYNRNLFDAAVVPYPQRGWTWEQFLAAARTLTLDVDGDGRTDQYGVGIDPSLQRLAPFVWQNGGELVDDPASPSSLALDRGPALEAFRWFVALQVTEHVAPDAVATHAESLESRFLNGRLAMYLNSRRGVPTYRTISSFDWDVAPLPEGRQPAGILHSDGYCLAAAGKDKDAAWRFIEFANSSEGQQLLAETGRTVPSLRFVAESPVFLDPNHPPANSRVFLDEIAFLRTVPVHAGWAAAEEIANREVERAFYGQASVEEAALSAATLTQPFFAPD
jgi:multiple sugar transport system substrate-binding protein